MRAFPMLATTLSLLWLGAIPAGAQQSGAARASPSEAAPSELLDRPARLEVAGVPLAEALLELSRRSGAPLAFSPSLLANARAVSCACLTVTVRAALDLLLAGTPFGYAQLGQQVLIEPDNDDAGKGAAASSESQPPALPANGVPSPLRPAEDDSGAIRGYVIEGLDRRPVVGAQVYIPGTGIGGLSDRTGRFVLPRVPAGELVVRGEMLGYRAVEKRVELAVGETRGLELALAQEALALEELVVTGTPGGAQRKAVGNLVERLDAAGLVGTAPALSLQELIGQRKPGVLVLPAPGMVGTGAQIRIRGGSSLSLTNHPLVYLDGIRVDANPAAGPNLRSRQVSRLNDFFTGDIEAIEVIKGPAAATLYGTEATNGVIQIITKRGERGPPRIELTLRQGADWMDDPERRIRHSYAYDPATEQTDSLNIYLEELRATGRPLFQTGRLQSVAATLTGGSDAARYYLSTAYEDNEGIVSYNWENRLSGRMNLSVTPGDTWNIDAGLGMVRSRTSLAQQANGLDLWALIVWSSPRLLDSPTRGFRYATPEAVARVEALSEVNRLTASVRTTYRPADWLVQRLTVGTDLGHEHNSILFPRVPEGEANFFGAREGGEKSVENFATLYNTVDYAATATLELGPDWRSATSAGAQYYEKQIESALAVGRNFPATAVTTVSSAATSVGGEDFLENKTLGVFVQQQVDWRDHLFVTAAVRADDNSAFGEDFDAAIYPKLSVTWVPTEEDFWRWSFINTLRLRTAWGQAGRQPDNFDAITLYKPTTGPGDEPILTPASLGDPGLKPERGEELELGLDASLLAGRLNLNFTYYDKLTRDALVAEQVRPSVGFPGTRMVNLGRVKNWGMELSLESRALEREHVSLDVAAGFATHESRVEDLGGLPPVQVAVDQEHRVGYAVASIFWYDVVHAEFDRAGGLVNVLCAGGEVNGHRAVPCDRAPKVFMGQPDPTWSGHLDLGLTLKDRLRLGAFVEFRGGHTQIDGDIQAGHTTFETSRMANPVVDPFFAANRTVVPRTALGLYDAGFAKLRELTARYVLPRGWVNAGGASDASISVGWRNVATLWQAQDEIWGSRIYDPEMRIAGAERAARFQTTLPPVSQVIATLRVAF